MKRILLLLLLSASALGAVAQSYNNEWIDYNKTYYKFKVGATGLYRIRQATLNSIGLGSVNADHFQLWRNGQEIPIYTSVQNAPLDASGYIEFWGEMNDGKPDQPLFREPDYQLNAKWSFQTDTAAFFLTVNPSGGNLRLVNTVNNVAGNSLPIEPFFIHNNAKYYRDRMGPGRAELVGDSYTYSASYDYGESFTAPEIDNANNTVVVPPTKGVLTFNTSNLMVYSGVGAPDPILKINVVGNAINTRYFKVSVNTDSIFGQEVDYYDYVKATTSFSLTKIAGDVANIEVRNMTTLPNVPDRLDIAQIELFYPRKFNFGGASNFYFELPANAAGNYLEIANFNYSGIAPVLYDLTNGKRYVGDISNPALVKFALLPSAANRKLMLVSQVAGNIADVTSFQQRDFVNYALPANQGDFLIITNPVLTGSSGGIDPIEDYRIYRSSPQGGGFNAKVYLIDQLIDQFAFGIKMHPLSIRNFLRWARVNYSAPLKNVFLIGKGVTYTSFRPSESSPDMAKLCLVPTFGFPASDNLLCAVGNSSLPLTPIGRLSVIAKGEIADYLAKVKQYEQVLQSPPSPLIADMAWKKNIVHVTGASDDVTTAILQSANEGFRHIIEDTLYGGRVYSFSKNSSESVEQLSSNQLASLFEQGLGIITYFGHSSASTLEFNLDNPQNYNNPGKYPVMIVMGCNAGNLFSFNVARFSTKETISERYVLAPQRGSVAFLASTHLGIVHYLDMYNTRNYQAMSYRNYGGSLGEIMLDAIQRMFLTTTENDFYSRFQCEEFALHGDPAVKMYSFEKPDYVIEDQLVKVSPSFISVAETNFTVKASFMNIGRAPEKPIVVKLTRTFPDGSLEIRRDTISATKYMDSITYVLPIVATRDKGTTKIEITIDADNDVDEAFETNNKVSKDVYIFEDEVRPIYPYNYSIVNQQNIQLIASTANAFAQSRNYLMEIDTTELFNSPLKVARNLTTAGGVMEFTPNITFSDSTVYYWRVAPYSPTGETKWNTASFIYINGTETGFNQSHLFQHFKSTRLRMGLDSASRQWEFGLNTNNIFAHNGVYPNTSGQGGFYSGTVNDVEGYIGPGCGYNELIFNIIDPVTFNVWKNAYSGGTGLYQSYQNTCGSGRAYNFEYFLSDINWRKKAMDFIDSIPDGYLVMIRSNTNPNTAGNTYPDVWKSDETTLGAGNSLYQKLVNQGFADIDSFNYPRSWILLFKKNGQSEFPTKWSFSNNTYDPITLSADMTSPDTTGTVTSPAFGPAKGWHRLKWKGNTLDNKAGDIATIDIVGYDINTGAETNLITGLTTADEDVDISSIDAAQYPYLKLKMHDQDAVNFTAYQLRYWMLTYDPVPEGAVAPNLYFTAKDTVEAGEPLSFGMAFKNISKVDFDSVKVKFVITDRNNVENVIPIPYQKNLVSGDTIQLNIPIDTKSLAGNCTMFINFNPDNDQPEHYLFNNYAFKDVYVKPDSLNPLLDVTFDGTHILNRDIVSPKPNILIKLKDEARYMVLDDTSLITVKVRYPDKSIRRFNFNNNSDTLQFIPAGQPPNMDNTASINFNPYFLQDGEYELQVNGKDRSGNQAGAVDYRVAFRVINKSMISNMLNYPNPFTTSTAFVFTLTGSQIPQNLRIQILTITGKVVREITKEELGPLRIGRNITEFKWDGTDQYGQKLANGIYLYRVITNLNGKSLDKYKSTDESNADNTDKFFNNGYGKMYLMR